MAAKTANLYVRIEPEVKKQAEDILSTLGIPASNAINIFYKQIILHKGIPFDLKIPFLNLVDISALSEKELHLEIEKGYEDMKTGRTRPANLVFAEMRKDYNL